MFFVCCTTSVTSRMIQQNVFCALHTNFHSVTGINELVNLDAAQTLLCMSQEGITSDELAAVMDTKTVKRQALSEMKTAGAVTDAAFFL